MSRRTVRTTRVPRLARAMHRGGFMPVLSTVSAHRRPLATAAAAAGLLFALGFVPSAQASSEPPAGEQMRTAAAEVQAAADPGAVAGPRLHPDSGADTTPYVLGAVGLAGAGGLLAARTRAVRARR
ncbi:hypothetical protein RM572_19420 [Streptomyces sp. DSM 42041]|uniref:LPXTG cell wall anchor domain-containing protein n=1 Tax=Streptomyces hazeniae TaxID=3075538 RepID=A0ABU2NZ79_9ACTN|nr:hypothetical protein [Streptomyces sp. DSM 42041]MDT0380928.1 hypothetical protein [Streptomyces sp. DSM 42041]